MSLHRTTSKTVPTIQHTQSYPNWLCHAIVVVIAVGFFIFVALKFVSSWQPQPRQPETPSVAHPNCNRHVEELLSTQPGALVEQKRQMPERQGALQGQSKPAQKWEEALQITTVVVSYLRASLKSEQDTAEKASNQMRNWSPVHAGSSTKYVGTMARVVTILKNLETDFEGWCETQRVTFSAVAKLLEKKVRFAVAGNVVNIAIENKLLQRSMKQELEDLEDMKTKLESLQVDINDMSTVLLHMGVKMCEKSGSNKDWEKGFTEQVVTSQNLKGRGSFLVDRVSKDHTDMREVTDHLDISNSAEDVPFQTQVLPQLKQLVNLLGNHGENVNTV